MDYPCGKFGDCSFSRCGSIVRTDTQTDADERLKPRSHRARQRASTRVDVTRVDASNQTNVKDSKHSEFHIHPMSDVSLSYT